MRTVFNVLSTALLLLFTLFIGLASLAIVNESSPAPATNPPPIDVFTHTVYLPLLVRPANNVTISQLNYSGSDEYVEITNNGPGDQNLDGWYLRSVSGSQTYNFSGVSLGVGQSVRVHSGPGAFSSPPFDLFWSKAYL